MNLDGFLPRVPVKNLADCASIGSFSLAAFPFFGGTITMISFYTDSTGSHSLVTEASVTESPADYAQPVIRAVDWGQVIVKTNPELVQDRDALFRVHVTAPAAAVIPDVQLTLDLNGATRSIAMTKPVGIPATRQARSLNFSYLAIIDKAWMKTGLNMTINLNGNVRRLTPTFGPATVLYLTLVPTTVMGMTSDLVDAAQVQSDVKTFWPLADVSVRTRAGFTSQVASTDNMSDLLDELRELHTLDQDPSHYYGFFSGNLQNLPFGGLGDKPGRDAIGLDYDNISLMPHELGHNFDLGHVDCGNPEGVDQAYPYAPTTTGSIGIDLYLNALRLPQKYVDLMSYCSPIHTSDYSYENVQDYLTRHPPQPFKTALAAPPPESQAQRSLFISGHISTAGKVSLRRLVPMNRAPVESAASEYQLEITDKAGNLHDYFVDLPQVDHPAMVRNQYFSAIVPYAEISSLALLHNGQVIYRESATAASPAPGVATQPSAAPRVVESAKQACLQWNAQNRTSATLIHHDDEKITTMAMDDTSGNLCVSTEAISSHGSWQILLRRGIVLQEFSQLR